MPASSTAFCGRQPHRHRTFIDEPGSYFEFPRTTFVHWVAFHDLRRLSKRFSSDHNHAVAFPRLLVIGPVRTCGKHDSLFFKRYLKLKMLLDAPHDRLDAISRCREHHIELLG